MTIMVNERCNKTEIRLKISRPAGTLPRLLSDGL